METTKINTTDHILQLKLWSKVKVTDPNKLYDCCWHYMGLRSPFGHGRITHNCCGYSTHRVAYMLSQGISELPVDVVVRHKCDVPYCVNPLHLETGSKEDNDRDREHRGRTLRGTRHGMAIIKDERTVREMRWLFHQLQGNDQQRRTGSIKAIGARYDVSEVVARYVIRRTTWQHVADDFDTLEPKPEPLRPDELFTTYEGNHGGSKRTALDIQRIRAMRTLGAPLTYIAKQMGGMAQGAVSQICNRKAWAEVPDADPAAVLSPEEIAAIPARLQ